MTFLCTFLKVSATSCIRKIHKRFYRIVYRFFVFPIDLEVGGALPSFPPTIDPVPSHNSSRKTNMAAPMDDDHEHWKRLFFQNQQILNQLMLKRPLMFESNQSVAKKRKACISVLIIFYVEGNTV